MLNRFLKKKQPSDISPELLFFLKSKLGIDPVHSSLYSQAFRHKSKSVLQNTGIKNSNERLEYLGDALIGMIVGEYLYNKYPNESEGFLSKMRSRIVSRENLNYYGECLELEKYIDYIKGKTIYKSLLGNIVEALFAAIYLDQGFESAKTIFITKFLHENTDLQELELNHADHKSQLIIYCQKNKLTIDFNLIKELMIDGVKHFEIGLTIDGKMKASGVGKSKREAEQIASEKVIQEI